MIPAPSCPPTIGTGANYAGGVRAEKTIKGTLFGSANPQYDIVKLLRLYDAGQLKLDELVTTRYTLRITPPDQAPYPPNDHLTGPTGCAVGAPRRGSAAG